MLFILRCNCQITWANDESSIGNHKHTWSKTFITLCLISNAKVHCAGQEHASNRAAAGMAEGVKRIVKQAAVVQCTGQQPKRAKGVAPKHESKRTVLSVKEGEWFTEAAALFPKTRAALPERGAA